MIYTQSYIKFFDKILTFYVLLSLSPAFDNFLARVKSGTKIFVDKSKSAAISIAHICAIANKKIRPRLRSDFGSPCWTLATSRGASRAEFRKRNSSNLHNTRSKTKSRSIDLLLFWLPLLGSNQRHHD